MCLCVFPHSFVRMVDLVNLISFSAGLLENAILSILIDCLCIGL